MWDKARASPAAELVAARRDLEACTKELASKREYQAEMRAQMDAKWEDLREKERDLRSAFIKYNKFVKASASMSIKGWHRVRLWGRYLTRLCFLSRGSAGRRRGRLKREEALRENGHCKKCYVASTFYLVLREDYETFVNSFKI